MKTVLEQLRQEASGIVNTTAHFIHLAKMYLSQDNIEYAKACLILLCECCDNYEESLEFNGLTDEWNQMAYLVDGLVSPSVQMMVIPRSPEQCSMPIDSIFLSNDDELLLSISIHIGELCADGECLHLLNKWERLVFYADELWQKINAGGIYSYLTDRGVHFESACKAIETIGADIVLNILDAVRTQFPKNRVPTYEDALQNALDIMEQSGVDFNAEDTRFYAIGDKQLRECLLTYIKQNQTHFR